MLKLEMWANAQHDGGMRSAWHCVRRAVGLADYRWALPRIFHSVATATQPVHRLQIRPIVHK